MSPSKSESNARSEREKAAYDKGNVFAVSDFYHRRTQVFQYPNTRRHEQLFMRLMERCARNARVLEIGCGDGTECERLFQLGASYVLGIDISEKWITEARKREIPEKLEFLCQDISNPINGEFDLIFGRAILHHVDHRSVLWTLYKCNLVQGGTLLFVEPLGENIIMRVFYFVARNAHTSDERPFMLEDLLWLQSHFPTAQVYPFNYTSLVSGVVLSALGIRIEDNIIMRASDRIDVWLARHMAFLKPRFRQFILVIRKANPDFQ